MIASLDDRFDVEGVVKPGSATETLMETLKGDVNRLTLNDFLIICSGTNYIDRKYPSASFSNITNLIKSVNHTNIIVVCVSHRHDLENYSYINNNIRLLNSKPYRLAKIFKHVSILEVDNNRLLFTKHGLHLNVLGKRLLTNQLSLQILSLLGKVKVTPIPLGWYKKNLQVITHALTPTKDKLPIEQVPKRIRKLPVTRKEDFMDNLEVSETGREINSIDCKRNMNQDQARKHQRSWQ
jgi:hypothetical protein